MLRTTIVKFHSKVVREFSQKPNSSITNSNISLKRFSKRALFGVILGASAYDAYNEFEVFGGLKRFLRSLQIAAVISVDYSWNLRGLHQGTKEYQQVRDAINFLMI